MMDLARMSDAEKQRSAATQWDRDDFHAPPEWPEQGGVPAVDVDGFGARGIIVCPASCGLAVSGTPQDMVFPWVWLVSDRPDSR